MVKQEYLRYIKSKVNLLLLFLITIPVLMSYFTTYLDKQEWINLLHSPAPDLNIEKVNEIVNGYNGMSYIDTFIFSNDFYLIFVIILLFGFGIHIGPVTFKHLESGYGSLIVTKLGYQKYMMNVIFAQSMYIVTFVISYFFLLFVITYIFGGGDFSIKTNLHLIDVQGGRYFLALISHIVLLIIYLIFVSIVTSLSTPYLKNQYILQIIPLCIYFLPLLIASTIGNITEFLGKSTGFLVSDDYLLSLYFYYNSSIPILEKVLSIVALPSILLLMILFLTHVNIKLYKRDYIK
ncbi:MULTISPECIES: hypothetical protein [unclassified Virgibacillus]|uniref:hypothetical protein n=1 Tax=unclassified Virgibacillus TaxID=2620237 RepID=UPI0024DEE48A|nr:hypothetical protein [Virgibacillus sp. LDC-1]